MDYLLAISALLLGLAGIVGCVVPVIPGLLLSYAGLLCAFFCSNTNISVASVWIWLAVTVVLSVVDYFLPAYLTKRFGGSRAASVGATIGLFVGLFFTPVGMILGTFLGAVIGELLNNRDDFAQALKSGVGSFFSFIISTGIKITASLGMMFVIVVNALWILFGK